MFRSIFTRCGQHWINWLFSIHSTITVPLSCKDPSRYEYMKNQNQVKRTSSPFLSVLRPDQKRWAQILTARHWSGFFSSLEAASAHWVLSGSWFSSLKHRIRSKVPMISVMAASWALESLISSSYREKAWRGEWIEREGETLKVGLVGS